MTDAASVSLGLAFVAGLVSFVSPCVLPLVPSYVTFVTGMSLTELTETSTSAVRQRAALHAALFVVGFGLVFVSLGATATLLGASLRRALPILQEVGGVVIVFFGLYLLGVFRLSLLMREGRVQLASKPAGWAGSVVAGIAFGAGWTPCVGPVLASILLYAGARATMADGMLLLVAYTLGLGVPFFVAAVALNWFLSGTRWLRRWLVPVERAAGLILVIVGVLLLSGRFSILSNFFAGFGEMVHLDL